MDASVHLKSNMCRHLVAQHAPRHPQDHRHPVGLRCTVLLNPLVQDAKEGAHGSQLDDHTHWVETHAHQSHDVRVIQLSQNSHLLSQVPTDRQLLTGLHTPRNSSASRLINDCLDPPHKCSWHVVYPLLSVYLNKKRASSCLMTSSSSDWRER